MISINIYCVKPKHAINRVFWFEFLIERSLSSILTVNIHTKVFSWLGINLSHDETISIQMLNFRNGFCWLMNREITVTPASAFIISNEAKICRENLKWKKKQKSNSRSRSPQLYPLRLTNESVEKIVPRSIGQHCISLHGNARKVPSMLP